MRSEVRRDRVRIREGYTNCFQEKMRMTCPRGHRMFDGPGNRAKRRPGGPACTLVLQRPWYGPRGNRASRGHVVAWWPRAQPQTLPLKPAVPLPSGALQPSPVRFAAVFRSVEGGAGIPGTLLGWSRSEGSATS